MVAIVAWIGIGERLRRADPGFGLLALVLGVASGAGMAAHGAYDLANFLKPRRATSGRRRTSRTPSTRAAS